jgi:hypothetical protein
MGAVKSVEVEQLATRDLALIDSKDAVWLVIPIRWWDFATVLFWLFLPGDRRARVKMKVSDASNVVTEVKMFAVRVATKHVRIRGIVGT